MAKAFYPVFYLLSLKIWQVRIQDSNYLNEDSHSDPRLIAYWERCLYLLDECPKPYQPKTTNNGRFVMHMSSKAQQVDMDFYNEIECLQAKGQCYEYLQAFASRASQLARRLATVFAYFEGLAEIDAVTLAGACDIVRYSSVHDKFHRTLILSGICLLKIARISLNSSFFPKPIKR